MASDLVIYGMKGSPFVRKVQVLLAEKGLESFAECIAAERQFILPSDVAL